MLQNARVAAFNLSELFRENQQVGAGEGVDEITTTPLPPRLGLRPLVIFGKELHRVSFTRCLNLLQDV